MPDSLNVLPVTLEGKYVRLEPLAAEHAKGLFTASQPPEIWELMIAAQPKTLEEMQVSVASCIESSARQEGKFGLPRLGDKTTASSA